MTVQHQASLQAGGEVETTLTIGDKSATFRSTSASPVVFDQPVVVNAAPGRETESSTETVTLASGTAPISITGGSYSLDGGAFVSTAGTVKNGQTVKVRHTTAAAGTTGAAATRVTVLSIGETKSTFATSVTGVATQALEVTGATGVQAAAEGVSLVSGPVDITVAVGFGEFSVDGQTWYDNTTDPLSTTLRPGQPLYFQGIPAAAAATTTYRIGSLQVVTLTVRSTP